MIVTFHSLDNDNNKIYFKSEAQIIDDYIVFDDKSIENTKIYLKYNSSSVIFKRVGNTNMSIEYIQDKITTGTYKNELGLEFNFSVDTTSFSIEKDKIIIEYNMYIEKDYISSHKIWILLR